MTLYKIRPGFTINQLGIIYQGGQMVDLDDLEFQMYKHELEGVDTDVIPIDFGVNNSDCCYPAPFFSNVSPQKILTGQTQLITVLGSFFTPDTTVDIESGSIDNIEFVSSSELKITVTTSTTAGNYDLIFDNGAQTILRNAIAFFELPKGLVDLRLGGTEFSDTAIEMRSTMSYQRLESGLVFSGNAPWGSWARFVGDEDAWVWNRDLKKTLSWIYQNTSNFMIGIGSRATNESNNSQFYQGEVLCYNSNGTTISSIYGNDGTIGNGQTQSSSTFKKTQDIIKIVFRQNGELGSLLSIYKLPSSDISDWFDTSNKLNEFSLIQFGDEPNIMPFAIPQNGNGSKFLGFVLEDQ